MRERILWIGRQMFADPSLMFFGALAAISIGLCWWLRGPAEVWVHGAEAGQLIVDVLPQLVLGVVIAGLMSVLLPRERVARLLGEQAGTRGILIATAIGAILPGGPFASFPLVLALFKAGADMGALIAFLVSWGTIGVNRLMVWEIPFLGVDFGILRLLSSLPIPILAGITARWLTRRYAFFRMPKD